MSWTISTLAGCGSGDEGIKATRIVLDPSSIEGTDIALMLGSGIAFEGDLAFYNGDELMGRMPVKVSPQTFGATLEVGFSSSDESLAFGNYNKRHIRNLLGRYSGLQMNAAIGVGFKSAHMYNGAGSAMTMQYKQTNAVGIGMGIPFVTVTSNGDGDFSWDEKLRK